MYVYLLLHWCYASHMCEIYNICSYFLVLPLYTADSVTFQLLPYGPKQDEVQVYCSDGTHAGKYLIVNSSNNVIAGAEADGDSVFLRQNVAGTGTLITFTLSPVNSPSYYVAFHADTGKAQLETQLTDRSKLELFPADERKDEAKKDVGDSLSALQLDPPGDSSPGKTGED